MRLPACSYGRRASLRSITAERRIIKALPFRKGVNVAYNRNRIR